MLELDGRVAVVTGGGQGLGEAICNALGDAKAIVVATDIRRELAQGVAARVEAHGGRALGMYLDVRDEDGAAATLRHVVDAYGRIDVLVNNAGVDRTVSIEELLIQEWDRIIATNLRGPFVLSKLCLPLMGQQGSGHIVNIVSTAAKRAWPNAAAYHASKWGLLGFSHALHVEARTHNVKVTAVVSGGMRTPFLLERFPDIDPSTLQDPRTVAETVRWVLTIPDESVVPEVMVIPLGETSWP
ncbi:MAG: SDR family NAD(P)-dependent oxidoreductase [Chloroflexi bacterium]|nr:SDR family NAD(P)-dependent oxidoreductase [Chloroflexota bacterium]